jgi:hypothetical protein
MLDTTVDATDQHWVGTQSLITSLLRFSNSRLYDEISFLFLEHIIFAGPASFRTA